TERQRGGDGLEGGGGNGETGHQTGLEDSQLQHISQRSEVGNRRFLQKPQLPQSRDRDTHFHACIGQIFAVKERPVILQLVRLSFCEKHKYYRVNWLHFRDRVN